MNLESFNMNEEEWNRMCLTVTENMSDYIKPYITPISRVIEVDYGTHEGSGSFISSSNETFIVTNEHVAKALKENSLAHQFFDSDCVAKILNPFAVSEYPIDLAVSKISDKAWTICDHKSQAIPKDKFSSKHSPVENEVLFMAGYSGDRSSFHFGTLVSNATPYLSKETAMPEDYGDSNYHFAIHYNPDLATSVDGSPRGLPRPPGFSGSLIWNTRAVELYLRGEEWSPKDARVTGIVWGWPSSDACLLATKVEHLNIDELMRVSTSNA
jgi:hypothetical protein